MSTGLYIHIPYCKKKCGYCGFVSYPLSCNTIPDVFLDTLTREMQLYRERYGTIHVDTVFIGGGTPSLLSAQQIRSLMDSVRSSFSVSERAEITAEANPDSLSSQVLGAYKQSGINRLSIGAQSMDDTLLKTLGRIHDSETFLRAYDRAVIAGFSNINIDLMFGLPGQSLQQWTATLAEVLSLGPSHLSLYTIQIEEGTPFYDAYKNGTLSLPPLNEDRLMYHTAVETLKERGWEHYEISNFASPGNRCLHNMKYWSMEPFIGLGPSAASYYAGVRYQNQPSIEDWSRCIYAGSLAMDGQETESMDDAMEIFCFTALRTAEGLDYSRFKDRFGMSVEEAYRHDPLPVKRWEEDGLVRLRDEKLALTEAGIDVSNDIMSAFMR